MILVTGALGFVGRHLIKGLLEAGQPVRALIPERAQRRLPFDSEAEGLEIVSGSVFDPEALYKAMTGVHTIYHLASAQWWGRLNDLEHVDLNGTQNVITAGRSARVGRIISLSHIGAEPSAGFTLLRVKGQMEDLIIKSGLAYTILRCGVLFGPEDQFVNHIAMLLRNNPFYVWQPGQGEALLNPLHIDDLVAALIKALDVLELVDATVEIGGAEYMTYNELLRTVMRVSGCGRSIWPMPPYLMRGVASLAQTFPLRWMVTPQWFDLLAGNRTAPLSNLYNYTGIRPRRFEDSLLTYMPKRRYGLEYIRYLFTRRRRSAF